MKQLQFLKMVLRTKEAGFTLVEVVVAIALFMVIIIGTLSANNLTTTAVGVNKKRSQANVLAKEAMEAVQSVRANNFNALMPGDFHPVFDQNGWHLAAGAETIGEFSRTITLNNVMRTIVCTTTICPIVSSGGVTDLNTFNVLIRVTWKEYNLNKEYDLSSMVTYWR